MLGSIKTGMDEKLHGELLIRSLISQMVSVSRDVTRILRRTVIYKVRELFTQAHMGTIGSVTGVIVHNHT